jgi:hypothetical protein
VVVALATPASAQHTVTRTRELSGARTLTVKKELGGGQLTKTRILSHADGRFIRYDEHSVDLSSGKTLERRRNDYHPNGTRKETHVTPWGTIERSTEWSAKGIHFSTRSVTHADGDKTWERHSDTRSSLPRVTGSDERAGMPPRYRFAENQPINEGLRALTEKADRRQAPVATGISGHTLTVQPKEPLSEVRARFDQLR